jgi:hypothetical protein
LSIHEDLKDVKSYPHTISFCCRKQMQIDSFMQLPEDKRPPRSIWLFPDKLDDWFDRVFDDKKENEFEFIIDPNDIEG